jgi:RimJ/RimL family protein N-acetyltransferase
MASALDVQRIYALCRCDHRASQRVLEKCGFERELGWTQQVKFPNLAAGIPQGVVCYARGPLIRATAGGNRKSDEAAEGR